jgi:hypothetical protein
MNKALKWFVPGWVRSLSRPPRRLVQRSVAGVKELAHTSRTLVQRIGQAVRGCRSLFQRLGHGCLLLCRRLLTASRLPHLARQARLLLRFQAAYARYCRTGVVPPDADPFLASVYTLTNGRLTDFLVGRLARRVPPVPEPDSPDGVMPPLYGVELQAVLTDLRRDGIHIFKHSLDPGVCAALAEFGHRTPCSPFGDHLRWGQPAVPFDPHNPIAPTYWFDDQTLVEAPPVQRILLDPTFLKVAQGYLGLEPILNLATMWWSTAFKRNADSRSAQLFHFDLDRAKFLKIFIYLTDVSEHNGPHVYVRGTHHRKVRPLLKTDRISDEELFSYYPRDRAVTVTAPKGTVFVADTRGFHKGLPLVSGTRLMFELEYVSDRFGRGEPVLAVTPRFSPAFHAWKERHPRLLCRFVGEKSAATTADLRIV